jgi:hypothetical protein
MLNIRAAGTVLGLILAVPLAGVAAPKPSHVIQGVVSSIDSNSLVIQQGAGTKKKEMSFVLDTATRREGAITVGSTVAVRYTNDASKLMAVDVQPIKAKATVHKVAAH